MKTKIYLVMSLMFLGIGGTIAQTTIQVPPSSTQTFTVQNPQNASTFDWSFNPATSDASDPSGTHTSNVSITFDANEGASMILQVIPISANSCSGDPKTVTIIITSTPSFTAAFSLVSSSVCPMTATQPTAGDLTATITVTGNTTGVNAGNPISIYYSIDGILAASPVFMSSASESVTFDTNWTTAGAHNVTITQVKFGGTSSTQTGVVANTTVDAVPSVDGIQ